jgi:uncharacterized protein (DUF169 family)
MMQYTLYTRAELELDILLKMPIENLEMIVNNLENAKESKQNEKSNMLPE